MTTLTQLSPPPDGMTRDHDFSVATALAWIGHDCSGGCPDETTTMPASVWFVLNSDCDAPSWATTTLVVVDLPSPADRVEPARTPAAVKDVLRRVNDCVGSEHIRVRERVSGEQTRSLLVLTERKIT